MRVTRVNKDVLGLYGKPETGSLIDEVLYGAEVELLKEEGEFAWIRTDYQYEGYVKRQYLQLCDWERENIVCVWSSYIDVLSMPKVQGVILQSVPRGGLLLQCAPADENGWVLVELTDGRRGYVKQKHIGVYRTEALPEEEMRTAVVETAKLYQGTQYRWGGKSPLGIDCSGLCSMAYLLNGVKIFRDAQIKEGFPVHEITEAEMKPGDLLYFPGHIAMYIGDGRYIHSTARSGSDGVDFNSLRPEDALFREDLRKSLYAVGSIY